MRFATIVASVCLCMAITATCSQAALIWTAGDPLGQGYDDYEGAGSPYYLVDTPSTGLLTQDTSGGYRGHFQLNTANRNNEMTPADPNDSWFVEWRMHTIAATGTDQVAMQIADGVSAVVLSMLPGSLKRTTGGTNGWAYVDGPTYSDGFHTFRVTKPAGGGPDFKLSVDGGAAADIPGIPYTAATFLEFGDSTSTNGGGQAQWDYVALNASPEVPEPASIVLLLCSGLVGVAVSRKR